MFHAKKTALALLLATSASVTSFAAGDRTVGAAGAASGTSPSATQPADAGKTNTGANSNPSRGGDTPPPKDNTNNEPRPGGIGKLPDAVLVLDLIRRLPKWPPRTHFGDDTDDEPLPGPRGSSGGAEPQAQPLTRPTRVVNIPANVPFKPAPPTPRGAGAPAAIAGASGPEALDREVLVTLTAASTDATVFALAQDFGLDGQTLYVSPLLGSRVVRFRIPDTRAVADVVQQLAGDARVNIVAPHYVYTASQGAAKPLPIPQYAPQKLKLDEAHKVAQGKKVKLAVIDTGVDTKHPVFTGARIETFDALGDNGAAETHGTAIAGIATARSELEGVAPAADLLSVRAFTAGKSNSAKSFTLAILKGLDWAVLNGARVVNMSFAGPDDPILAKAVAAAEARGLVLIAAAGNGGPDAKPAYPAAYPQVLAVTATDDRDGLYKDANRGSYIAVAAPGVDIIAAAPGGAYDVSSGTSLAAAHVSGIAALMIERNPKLTAADVRAALSKSAHRIDGRRADEMGAGVADAAAALDAVK